MFLDLAGSIDVAYAFFWVSDKQRIRQIDAVPRIFDFGVCDLVWRYFCFSLLHGISDLTSISAYERSLRLDRAYLIEHHLVKHDTQGKEI